MTIDNIDWDNGLIRVNKTIQALSGQGLVIGEPKSESSRRPVAMPQFVQLTLVEYLTNCVLYVKWDAILTSEDGTSFQVNAEESRLAANHTSA